MGADRKKLRQLGDAAVVVGMKVRDQQIVNPRDSGVTGGGGDPQCVSRVARGAGFRLKCPATRKPRINEQRLAGRRHDQGGLTTFDIDEVDFDGL